MGAVTAVSRTLGFVRVLVIAAVVGTTYLGNTFQASNSVSNVLFELVAAGALSAVLVPTFVAHLARNDRAEIERLAGGLLGLATIVLGALSLLGVVFAPFLARVLTSGAAPAVAAQQRHLATFLLYFFVPQLVLYGWGAIATALLYAERKFIPTAAAPIGNTVVTVAAMAAFAAVVAAPRGLDLSLGPRLLLVLAGTGGVIAFVGVLVYSAHAAGYRMRPHADIADPAIRRLLKLSAYGILLHAAGGLLLGGALIIGNSVAGGVVAYQTAFTFFLAPYAVLALPIQTAVLPEISTHAYQRDIATFADTLEWALTRIAVIVLPVSAALAALAYPLMRFVVFGQATAHNGVSLLAAGLASLAAGLFCYSAFLTVARGYYAIGDGRTPAIVALVCGVLGVVVMAVGASVAHGSARVAALGLGHSACYTVGVVFLGVHLARRLGRNVWSFDVVRALVAAAGAGLTAWGIATAIGASTRVHALLALAAGVVLGGAVYVAIARFLRLTLVTRTAQ
jgi:putative peptidoglycan lipid II flippase